MSSGPLDRYWRVLGRTERARYLESKESTVNVSIEAGDEELMRAHDEALEGAQWRGRGPALLEVKIELARRAMMRCVLCERRCYANRASGEAGHCGVLDARVSSEFIHMGEEPELVPSYTIFFSGCTFDCVYCQNSDISTRPRAGAEISPGRLAKMISARARSYTTPGSLTHDASGAANVNWVGGDPTSNIRYILETMNKCDANLPQVWNSNMYLTCHAMNLLRGVIDVYLTDFKYGNDECAKRLSEVDDYTRIVKRNHLLARDDAEMIVRHLVLPNHVECCTRPILGWIADNLEDVKVNVMGQYRPCHHAMNHEDISRPLRPSEYESALRIARDLELDMTL
ncbi:MAG: radical SAM protein [Methanobacteriota archaeon]|nr:MAG: radical SAM protein [Euryarchaeota archaeon]